MAGFPTRPVIRIASAVLIVLLIGVFGLKCAINQSVVGSDPRILATDSRPDELERHVRFMAEDAFPRNFRNPLKLDQVADYIRDHFLAAGIEAYEQTYEVRGFTARNIIGRIGPQDGPRIVLGAHYDICGDKPGADDNASGVAGLLEAARLLASANPKIRIDLVAWSTEEPPFFGTPEMGSAIHADSLKENQVEVRAMVCLEMIGYFSDEQPAPSPFFKLLYPSTGNFILIAGRWQDRDLVGKVKRSFQGISGLETESYCGPTGIGTDLSDHRNYWAAGYPAVMVTDTAFIRNRNYHTEQDTSDSLDYRRMAQAVDGVVNAVLHLAED
ncbi:MAG: M20/M25/M40 family metallo-hydrolase [Acidobacteria bacterium]|uniref:M20/M25/M40 family metallo-hydrolase n=1 Tax=Candidatus Polarisedimenticola svalbardensis TaxID=2886004 RepID=A0A8J6Y184_9BACT|nr:M20/M25/M40 family metallo-hydrolase [Candidatus Polarisedimenticola svalbardensis]